MDGIIYLTLEQVEQIHRKTITYSGGGTYEPLDVGKLARLARATLILIGSPRLNFWW